MAQGRQPERREPPGHGSANRGRRGLLPAGVAVVLVALVAVGSLRGPLGGGRGRPSYPADLIDSLLLLLFLAMVAAGVLAVVVLWPGRALARPRRRGGGSWNLILPMAAVVLLWLFRDLLGLGGGDSDPAPTTTIPSASTLETPAPPPESGVVPLIVAGLALAAMIGIVVAQVLADRRRRRPPRTPAERLVALLDDTLEDLEREPDPRRAVIGAWARMEAGLAAAGLPRRPAEAPFEYAARVLETALAPTAGALRPDSVHRLTGLFERAKFSRHDIGEVERDQAIAALRTVRRQLAEAVEQAAKAEAAARARAAGEPVGGPADGDPVAGRGNGR
ncbi:MAG TPA: DUF4129 domain-containing protein [Actinomycetes bacterium]|nr:DUF4129 domain-containing protein [Actinomycetes bacterium]